MTRKRQLVSQIIQNEDSDSEIESGVAAIQQMNAEAAAPAVAEPETGDVTEGSEANEDVPVAVPVAVDDGESGTSSGEEDLSATGSAAALTAAEKRAKDADRKRRSRAAQTEEEKETERARQRERMRLRRSAQNDDEKQKERERQRERMRKRRASLNDDEREKERERQRERMRRVRKDADADRRARDADRKRKARAAQTEEEKEQERAKQRERMRKRRSAAKSEDDENSNKDISKEDDTKATENGEESHVVEDQVTETAPVPAAIEIVPAADSSVNPIVEVVVPRPAEDSKPKELPIITFPYKRGRRKVTKEGAEQPPAAEPQES